MLSEKIAGVAAVFHVPSMPEKGFVTLQELRTKRSTNKIAMQRTIPMETSLPGEKEIDTLARLAVEEVQFTNFRLGTALKAAKRIAISELNIRVFVPVYSIPIPSDVEIILGSEAKEVADLDWTSFDEIVSEPSNSLFFRPGNYEAIKAHLTNQIAAGNFIPMRYGFYDLRHKIPSSLFDLVESGFSVETALSQLGLSWRPVQDYFLPTHSQSQSVSV